nr:transcriptional regulator [Kitasatospora acidiphila]
MWADAPEAFASALTGDRVTDTMVSTLEQRVAALRTMDEQLGGGRLLEHAQGDLSLITDLLKSGTYTEAVGARMYALAARICYLTGWIAYDSGLRSAGQQYYVGALRASRTAGDGAFGAFVLAEMGVHAGDAGDTQSRVRLIETAIDSAPKDMPAATQSFLQLHHAEAMSRDGQTQQSATALNASMALWDRHRSTGEALPEWLQWYGQAQLESTEGKIMLRSGSTDRATAALEASIAMAVPRDKATRAPRLAEARLAGGDLDGALDAANAGAALLEGPVSSDRAVTRLNEFSRQLDKYSAVPAVREFRDRLRALPMAS